MKYFVRAVKYFIYFSLLTALIVGALVLIGAVEGNIDSIFEGGWGSIWKIAVFFAAVSAIYPKLGFIRREVPVEKDWNEVRSGILEFFADRRYVIETETPDQVTFRLRGISGRLPKMYEDRITVTSAFDGIQIDGLRKDVIRLATGLDARLNQQED
mgnify:CR=1 FL=1